MYIFLSISNSLSECPKCQEHIFMGKVSNVYIDLNILFKEKL